MIDELIMEGNILLESFQKQNYSSYMCISGKEYELWMGKVQIYTNTILPDCLIKDELNELYQKRNRYLGDSGVIKVLEILEAVNIMNLKKEGYITMSEQKVFISHSSSDKIFGDALVFLLKGLGLSKSQLLYTSNDVYGIPLGKNIFQYLRENIEYDVHMVFLLSQNYFNSVACLNEMGAAWMAKNDYTIIGTPGFDFNDKCFRDCCIDSQKMGILMDNYVRMAEFKEMITKKFILDVDAIEWEQLFEEYKNMIENIKSGK